ncbi:GNAT family N-acetyltransferase [Clostridium uliginosum]|uniref:8-oxo-dGTP diphosphatase n=1 Tax=Clostridium uliginosum TaxID=119641 RepID=A0A1I1JQR3_9CLOT|nr:GNAT family N-acetyltransferase [Clostridium uliginosum]SFC50904.1 8-oxo-dGTP diphosphatase [Clostridium uliginosum]
MNQKTEIIEFLIKDEINNINIINFIEDYPIYYIEKIDDSVIVKGTSDKNWIYISSKSEEELKIIKSRLDNNDKNFAAIEEWMLPILTNKNKIKWRLSTMKLILCNDTYIVKPKHNVSDLTINDAEFIYENSDYKDFISIQYIIDRITNGISSCIRYMDKPIAWAITQDDGAIGFLHVLPEYRKMGYARDVTIALIKKVRDKNKIPFVHIEEENEKSMRLATGLGFKKDKVVNWFEIE